VGLPAIPAITPIPAAELCRQPISAATGGEKIGGSDEQRRSFKGTHTLPLTEAMMRERKSFPQRHHVSGPWPSRTVRIDVATRANASPRR